MIAIILIILKPLASEADKIVKAVLSGKLSNRKFLLHMYNAMMANSQKDDFWNTAGLDLPRKETEHIKPESRGSENSSKKYMLYTFYNTKGKYEYLDLYRA